MRFDKVASSGASDSVWSEAAMSSARPVQFAGPTKLGVYIE